jgi:peptidyl-prolyl cis-trans isomerase A (cyclophilin A)
MDTPTNNAQAPQTYQARFETSQGAFTVEVTREWAPLGADRFFNLIQNGFYDGSRFFRVLPGFVVQFGIAGDPTMSSRWRAARIADDPVKQTNATGTITFATAGPGTRTTQVFINLVDNGGLDGMGFAPFGRVVEGMDVVGRLYSEYGEGAPRGQGPEQGRIQSEGNAYLEAQFPKLDFIKQASVLPATA